MPGDCRRTVLSSLLLGCRRHFFWLLLVMALPGMACRAGEAKAPLPPVTLNGRPFFPIGVYDLARSSTPQKERLGDVDEELYEAGVNTAFFGNLGLPDDPMYPGYSHIVKAFEKRKGDTRFARLALIVNVCAEFYCEKDEGLEGTSKRSFRPLDGARLKERQAFLAEAMQALSKYPNIIGYSYDEPENTFSNYFQSYRKQENIDSAIGAALVQWMGWMRPFAERHHPGSKWLPIIAWWGTYKDVAPLYDVLIADQYPRGGDGTEFSGPLYEVSFDAARMATAARAAGGGRSAIYMPPCFDRLEGSWIAMTRAEQRYVMFAPVTRGAMGIIAWRLNRASQKHRDEVLYPTLRELARFQEYFLGEWHDSLVKSDHDEATVDYLKQFAVHDRLLNDDKENGGFVEVDDFVPDVSHCLRRRQDGRWLLLAVNNRRERLSVSFEMALPFSPASMVEALAGRSVSIGSSGAFTDEFAPFGVHAYIIRER